VAYQVDATMNLKNKFLLIYLGGMFFAIVGLVLGSAILALTSFFIMITAFVAWNVLRRR
jgi:Flp pilus assembly protein TadB